MSGKKAGGSRLRSKNSRAATQSVCRTVISPGWKRRKNGIYFSEHGIKKFGNDPVVIIL